MLFKKKKKKEKKVTDVIYGFDNFNPNRKIGDIVGKDRDGKEIVIACSHPDLIRLVDLEKNNDIHQE